MTRLPSIVRSHKTLFIVAALAPLAMLPGCGLKDDADGFRGGVPRHEAVEVRVPGGAQTGSLTAEGGARQSALLGQKAEYYVLTRTVTAVINGGTFAVLTLVKTIVGYPATSVSGDTAVWGPHTEPLSPNTWRLTVTRLEPHKFQYALDAKAKTADDSAFKTILAGTHTRAVTAGGLPIEGFGSGTFTADWDAAQTLPEHGPEVGKAMFTYSRESLGAKGTVDVVFNGIKEEKTGELFDAVYKFAETPGAGGDFQYGATQDYLPEPGNTGTAKEKLTIRSRWQQTGAGRSDVKLSGGDLAASGTVGTANECWDSNFGSVYKAQSWLPLGGWGTEGSCVFTPAEYSTL
jgi:hypothetical protein